MDPVKNYVDKNGKFDPAVAIGGTLAGTAIGTVVGKAVVATVGGPAGLLALGIVALIVRAND